MMTQVQCVTCGQAGEAITDNLFMGKLEAEIKSKVCKSCWKKWESMRVMVINEYQINLGDILGLELESSNRGGAGRYVQNQPKLSPAGLT